MTAIVFTVTWCESAVNDLARLWLVANDAQKNVITRAVDLLDRDLRIDAPVKGISSPSDPNLRKWEWSIVSPDEGQFSMTAFYTVDHGNRIVNVLLLRKEIQSSQG